MIDLDKVNILAIRYPSVLHTLFELWSDDCFHIIVVGTANAPDAPPAVIMGGRFSHIGSLTLITHAGRGTAVIRRYSDIFPTPTLFAATKRHIHYPTPVRCHRRRARQGGACARRGGLSHNAQTAPIVHAAFEPRKSDSTRVFVAGMAQAAAVAAPCRRSPDAGVRPCTSGHSPPKLLCEMPEGAVALAAKARMRTSNQAQEKRVRLLRAAQGLVRL